MSMISLCLWFNLYSTPAVVIFPELNDELINLLWFNEVIWLLEIIRKIQFNV